MSVTPPHLCHALVTVGALLTQEHIGQVGLLPSMSSSAERDIVSGVPPGNVSTFIRNVFTQQIPTPPIKQPQLWGEKVVMW